MQPKATKLSEESLVNAHLKSNLIYPSKTAEERKKKKRKKKTRSKNKSYSTMFSFLAHTGNPHLQVKNTSLIL